MGEGTRIKICPRCKSSEVDTDNSNPVQAATGMPPKYVCLNCGYSGLIFPEVSPSDAKKVEVDKPQKEGKQIDVTYGKFVTGTFWKIISPAGFLIGLLVLVLSKNPTTRAQGGLLLLVSGIVFYLAYFRTKKE